MSDEFLDLRRRTICAERGAKRRALLRVELIGCVRLVADTAVGSPGLGKRISHQQTALFRELEGAFA